MAADRLMEMSGSGPLRSPPGKVPGAHRHAGRPVIALDLLRGLAAITVLLVHARGASFVEFGGLPADQKSLPLAALFGLTRLGPEAVLVFFVLSGFLVGGQVIARLRDGSFRLSDYVIDRCSRILLPLISACLFTEAVNVLVFHRPDRLVDLLGSMCGLNGVLVNGIANNAALWTLAYEIWFYVAGGACALLISRSGSRIPTVALIGAGLCVVVFSRLDARFLLYWIIGALMIFCLNIEYRKLLALAGAALSVAAIVVHQLAWSGKSFAAFTLLPIEISEALIVVGLCLSLPALCMGEFERRIAPLRPLAAATGGFSYSLYLIHTPTISVLNLFWPKATALSSLSVGYFALRVVICIVVAIIFYGIFERNTYRLRRYVRSKLSAGRLSVDAAALPVELLGGAAADDPAGRR